MIRNLILCYVFCICLAFVPDRQRENHNSEVNLNAVIFTGSNERTLNSGENLKERIKRDSGYSSKKLADEPTTVIEPVTNTTTDEPTTVIEPVTITTTDEPTTVTEPVTITTTDKPKTETEPVTDTTNACDYDFQKNCIDNGGKKCVKEGEKDKCICLIITQTFDVEENRCVGSCDDAVFGTKCKEIAGTKCINDGIQDKCICTDKTKTLDVNQNMCIDHCETIEDETKMTWNDICNKTKAKCKVQLKNITCDCLHKDYHFDSDQKRCRIKSQCNAKVCGGGAICISIDDTYAAECNCTEKKQYYDYLNKKCSDINKCLGIVCDAFKECKAGECKCKNELKEDGENCTVKDEICKDLYGVNAKCNVKSDSFGRLVYSFDCDKGYYFDPSLKKCDGIKEDYCKMGDTSCQQTCTIDNEMQKCGCHEGFTMNSDNKTCDPEGKDNKTCDNGIWKDSKCVCNLGYVHENNKKDKCVHICDSQEIKKICPMSCASWNKKKFKCNCTGKYEYSKDGNTCIEKALCAKGEIGDVECSKKNAGCEKNKHNDEGYECVCPKELRELENGICSSDCTSEETQECIKKNLECEYDPKEKIKRCICPLSMVMSTSGACEFANNSYYMNIVLQNPEKHSRSFKRDVNEANKLSVSYHEIKQRMIKAMTILYGDSFQTVQVIKCNLKDNDVACDIIIIFENEFKSYERINKGHSCYRAANANYCFLHPNLILSVNDLKTAEIVEFNNCDDRIRESFCPRVANNCTSKHPGYDCFCNKGFKAIKTFYKHNTEYQYCEDIDECLDANICGSNSNCINTFGNFTCSCRDGFVRNKNKNEFECEVSGERKTRHVLSIVGSVLGTFLLLSLLLIIILAIRLRKRSKISQRSNESLENINGRPVYVNQGSSHDILFQESTHHETNPVSIPRVNRYRKQLRNPSVHPIEHYEDYP